MKQLRLLYQVRSHTYSNSRRWRWRCHVAMPLFVCKCLRSFIRFICRCAENSGGANHNVPVKNAPASVMRDRLVAIFWLPAALQTFEFVSLAYLNSKMRGHGCCRLSVVALTASLATGFTLVPASDPRIWYSGRFLV